MLKCFNKILLDTTDADKVFRISRISEIKAVLENSLQYEDQFYIV